MTFERGPITDVDADARDRAKQAAIGYVVAPLLSTRSNLPHLLAVGIRFALWWIFLLLLCNSLMCRCVGVNEEHNVSLYLSDT